MDLLLQVYIGVVERGCVWVWACSHIEVFGRGWGVKERWKAANISCCCCPGTHRNPALFLQPQLVVSVCRRLLQNPAYYDLEDACPEGLSRFMTDLVEDALQALADSGCVVVSSGGGGGL